MRACSGYANVRMVVVAAVGAMAVSCGETLILAPTSETRVAADSAPDSSSAPAGETSSVSYSFAPSRTTPVFFEGFDRPDGDAANGWHDKASAYQIQAGRLRHLFPGSLIDHLFIRPEIPPSDVEVAVTLSLPASDPSARVLLFARAGIESEASSRFAAYALRLSLSEAALTAYRSPEIGSELDRVLIAGKVAIEPSLSTGQPYRIFLRVTGVDSAVTVEAGVFQLPAMANVVSLHATDDAADRITWRGETGFGADVAAVSFDDFQTTF